MTNDTLHRLIDAVVKIPAMESNEVRDTLLSDIPGSCNRSLNPFTDLSSIVTYVVSLGTDAAGGLWLIILRRNIIPYAPLETERGREISHCFEELVKETSQEHRKPESFPPPEVVMPFVNHIDEKNSILSSTSVQYQLLDGPAGYGKTELLRMLNEDFRDRQHYLCGYASARGKSNLFELISVVCMSLDIPLEPVFARASNAELLGKNFANQLLSKFSSAIHNGNHTPGNNISSTPVYEGVVLFFDDIGPSTATITSQLLEIFIPAVERVLHQTDYFGSPRHRFRMVACGRYLAHYWGSPMERPTLTMHHTTLKPFDYDVVYRTALTALPTIKPETLSQISAHILYLTGGHPGCLARAIKLFGEHTDNPDGFIKDFASTIWDEIVSPRIDEITKEVPNQLYPAIYRLSIYRILNGKILEPLINEKEIEYSKHVDSLTGELLGTFLFKQEKHRMLRDSVIRRLFMLQFRQKETPSSLATACNKAYNAYLSFLKDPEETRDREFWAIECLYQSLQEHSHLALDHEKRIELREKFFSTILPSVIDTYVLQNEAENDLEDILIEIENDWDFRFTVNYYLRDTEYSDEPMILLKSFMHAKSREVKDAKAES